jgi:hypothetical protein
LAIRALSGKIGIDPLYGVQILVCLTVRNQDLGDLEPRVLEAAANLSPMQREDSVVRDQKEPFPDGILEEPTTRLFAQVGCDEDAVTSGPELDFNSSHGLKAVA